MLCIEWKRTQTSDGINLSRRKATQVQAAITYGSEPAENQRRKKCRLLQPAMTCARAYAGGCVLLWVLCVVASASKNDTARTLQKRSGPCWSVIVARVDQRGLRKRQRCEKEPLLTMLQVCICASKKIVFGCCERWLLDYVSKKYNYY